MYAAVIGNIRQIPAKPSRIVNLLVFGGLGLALFEMLALRPAFKAASATDLFAAVIAGRKRKAAESRARMPEEDFEARGVSDGV